MNQANTAQVVQFHTVGGHLQLDEVPLPVPAKGEVRLRVKAIGINRVEELFWKGKYFIQPTVPSKVGVEAAGVVDAVGPDVDPSWVGKSVGTCSAIRYDGLWSRRQRRRGSCRCTRRISRTPLVRARRIDLDVLSNRLRRADPEQAIFQRRLRPPDGCQQQHGLGRDQRGEGGRRDCDRHDADPGPRSKSCSISARTM